MEGLSNFEHAAESAHLRKSYPYSPRARNKAALNTPLRVLICDDNVDIRREFAERLKKSGVKVERACSSKETLNRVGKKDFQVVILDCALSRKMDGIETAQQIQQIRPYVRFIYLTAYATPDYRHRAEAEGVPGKFIGKDSEWLDNVELATLEEVEAWKRLLKEEKILESFRGKVERIDGSVAYVTLVDNKGQESFADCDAAKLTSQGILDGMRFTCTIRERDNETVVTFEPIPKRRLSDEEWHRLCQEIEEKLGKWDARDDY